MRKGTANGVEIGNDQITVGSFEALYSTGLSDDILRGDGTGDWISPGPGADQVNGAGGNDVISITGRVDFAGDVDSLSGGPGSDWVAYSDSFDVAGLRLNLGTGKALFVLPNGSSTATSTLTGIENVVRNPRRRRHLWQLRSQLHHRPIWE